MLDIESHLEWTDGFLNDMAYIGHSKTSRYTRH